MDQQLGLAAIRLPGSVEELGARPMFAAAASAGPLGASELAAWLQQARQQAPNALDWPLVLRVLKGACLTGPQAAQLVAVLARAADGARERLEAAAGASGTGRPSGRRAQTAAAAAVPASGDPRLPTALRNSLKLALFFLCCLARGEGLAVAAPSTHQPGGAGGQKRGGGGGKKAKGGSADSAADAASAMAGLRARRDALMAVAAIEEAVQECRALLPSVPDLQAAGRAAWAAALHCLAHPPAAAAAGGDRGAKDLAEAVTQAAAGILARELVAAEQRQSPAAAAQTLQDLLSLAAEPKQAVPVLAAAARLVASGMQQSSRAGAAAIGGLADRIKRLAEASLAGAAGGCSGRETQAAAWAAAAAAGQQLDACLHFASLLAGAPQLQAALLACLPTLLPLVRHPSSSTRRLMLDLFTGLLPAAASLPQSAAPPAGGGGGSGAAAADAAALAPPAAPAASPAQALSAALLAAVASRLQDRDATLRSKALAGLEKHVSLAAAHLNRQGCAAGGSSSSAGDGGGQGLILALCRRLCDKSPSVRKRAIALLAALLQPAAGLAPAAAAVLADAALPVASRLLGVRPDSALRPGEDAVKVLSQAVLRMAAAGSSAAGVPHLLQLAAGASEAAARSQLQAAALDLLLPPAGVVAGQQAAGQALLHSLTAALAQCSQQQVEQLRQAAQSGGRSGSQGLSGGAAAAASSAVRLCYRRLHLLSTPGSRDDGGEQADAATLEAAEEEASAAAPGRPSDPALTAAALFVLGPLSIPDAATGLAELGLLLSWLQRLDGAAGRVGGDSGTGDGGSDNSASIWVLRCVSLAWQQLGPACFPSYSAAADSQHREHSSPSPQHAPAAAAACQATLLALQATLLSPSCSSAARRAALDAAFALPAAAQAPLHLLRSLSTAATSGDAAAAAAVLAPTGPARLQLDEEEGQLRLVAPPGTLLPFEQPSAALSAGGEAPTDAEAPDSATDAAAAQRQRVQQCGLVGLLDLLGALSASYEAQRAEFLQQLRSNSGQRSEQQRQEQQHTSRAGRPLRPASEWWLEGAAQPAGDEEPAAPAEPAVPGQPGSSAAADAGPAAPAPAAGDYLQAEDEAAKQAEAAQRFVESLLAAGDTPPACYLPLLERLAAGSSGGGTDGAVAGGGGDQQAAGASTAAAEARLPPAVQAAALRALGRLALLSDPLSRGAVAAAERGLLGGGAEVQVAAVAVLEGAISAFPNAYSDRLALVGQLMCPPEAAAVGSGGTPAGRWAAAAAGATSEGSGAEEAPAPEAGPTSSSAAAPAGQPLPLAPTPQQQQQQQPQQRRATEQVAQAAAASYCRLLLHNKLKLQGQLGPLGSALVAGSPAVAAVVRHALRQLLAAAAPKERARLTMALWHQTPLAHRAALAQAMTDPAAGLLAEADLRGDVLVSQALQALLAAAAAGGASGAGPDGAAGLAAAAALLRSMQPSAKVLGALSTQLQAGSGASSSGGVQLAQLPATARRALQAFVHNHQAAAAGGQHDEEEPAEGAETTAGAGKPGGAAKRKRGGGAAAGAAKGGSAALQQQLLGLLAGGGGGGGNGRHGAAGRPPRPPAAPATSLAAAAPTASSTTASHPASSTRGGAGGSAVSMSRRTTRSGAASRRTSTAAAKQYSEDSDSDMSS